MGFNFFDGFFGSGSPYGAAMDQYKKYYGQAAEYQNPFYKMGTEAIPQYQEWLSGQKNPGQFINSLSQGYQESPWAHYQQQEATRAGTNMASANGLSGSTPMAQFMQQKARNISSQDMQQWLANALGINTQYGQGLQNEITGGQNAANQLTNVYTQLGDRMGEGAFGRQAGRRFDFMNALNNGFMSSGQTAGIPQYYQASHNI